MFTPETILQKVCKAFKQGEITEIEATRELYKHGFAHFGNDTNSLYFYLENTKF